MKFGSVEKPEEIDFTLPDDHPDTAKVLSKYENGTPEVYVGCAKWSRKDLKGLYPRGTKDELEYYGSQFNAVELNATFYRNFPSRQVEEWREKVPSDFKFFPKINRQISHRKWLANLGNTKENFLDSVVHFKEKLGTIFLQLREDFSPKHFERVQKFIENWPDDIPLAVELRHPEWFNDSDITADFYSLLEENDIANVIVDTAGRRDLLHMRLTNNSAFIRYVGANHRSDYTRLDDWAQRLKKWNDRGLQNIRFFVHQNEEKASPKLSAYFIEKLNETLGTGLHVPNLEDGEQYDLF